MKTRRYRLRLHGLREPAGQIRAVSLQRVLNALIETAARATRLIATGEGSARGRRPQWLDATVDFTVAGLKPGSTELDMDAPFIRETAYAALARRERPELPETALDCAALAIEEAHQDDPPGDYFDGAVLDAILLFRKAAGSPGVRYELTAGDSGSPLFALDDGSCARVRQRLNDLTAPRAFVVSGRLDEITHGSGGFRLVGHSGEQLLGRLHSSSLRAESLRPLWGRQATVEGTVHFKANGQPRFIEARRIGLRQAGDEVFDSQPAVEAPRAVASIRDQQEPARAASFMRLWGTWPGDEPVAELLDQID